MNQQDSGKYARNFFKVFVSLPRFFFLSIKAAMAGFLYVSVWQMSWPTFSSEALVRVPAPQSISALLDEFSLSSLPRSSSAGDMTVNTVALLAHFQSGSCYRVGSGPSRLKLRLCLKMTQLSSCLGRSQSVDCTSRQISRLKTSQDSLLASDKHNALISVH